MKNDDIYKCERYKDPIRNQFYVPELKAAVEIVRVKGRKSKKALVLWGGVQNDALQIGVANIKDVKESCVIIGFSI